MRNRAIDFGVATARDGGESMGGGVLGMLAPCSEGWVFVFLARGEKEVNR